jgi:nucleoside phosphorylase
MPATSVAFVQYLKKLGQNGCLHSDQSVLLMGLCGGLMPELMVGDGVIYQQCVGRSPTGLKTMVCDRSLTDWLDKKLAGQVVLVTAVTSDRGICCPTEKQQLAQETQAAVVDMEGFAAIQYLQEIGIQAATLRVISDACHHPIPDLSNVFNSDGALRPLALTSAMLRQPLAATHLIRGSLKGLSRMEAIARQLFSTANI